MAFTLSQIQDLVNAGYDLQEILTVNGTVEKPVETVENPAPAPAPAPVPAPAPAPATAPAPAVPQDNAILDAIQNLTNIIQNGNIRMGGFPAPANANDPQEILAKIINPPAKTAGKK